MALDKGKTQKNDAQDVADTKVELLNDEFITTVMQMATNQGEERNALGLLASALVNDIIVIDDVKANPHKRRIASSLYCAISAIPTYVPLSQLSVVLNTYPIETLHPKIDLSSVTAFKTKLQEQWANIADVARVNRDRTDTVVKKMSQVMGVYLTSPLLRQQQFGMSPESTTAMYPNVQFGPQYQNPMYQQQPQYQLLHQQMPFQNPVQQPVYQQPTQPDYSNSDKPTE